MFYSTEARRKLEKLIDEVSPDLIYVLHFQNKISSSIFDAAKSKGIPVVHRISDFGQICANAHFYRPKQRDICERCLKGSKLNAIRYKCVHDSYVYSAIKVGSLKFQEWRRLKDKVDGFVVPSRFTLQKLENYGIDKTKLNYIPTFFNPGSLPVNPNIQYEPFALFIGRIEPEKGLYTLVNAFLETGFPLKIVGFSNTGYEQELKEYLRGKSHKIEFLGKKPFSEIQQFLSRCLFTVVPSEWYDNLPNTLLESFAFKKCAIATDTGSLRELVVDNQTGLLFKIKDSGDLREKIAQLFNNPGLSRALGENAYEFLNEQFSEKKHYDSLMALFQKVILDYKNLRLRPHSSKSHEIPADY
ncbi:MAG: glycosyltransferase family 4 protein [Bacteroidota bacterium]|nr:glycosyltransferase family 4 protein [Bacteroidota bacterium]